MTISFKHQWQRFQQRACSLTLISRIRIVPKLMNLIRVRWERGVLIFSQIRVTFYLTRNLRWQRVLLVCKAQRRWRLFKAPKSDISRHVKLWRGRNTLRAERGKFRRTYKDENVKHLTETISNHSSEQPATPNNQALIKFSLNLMFQKRRPFRTDIVFQKPLFVIKSESWEIILRNRGDDRSSILRNERIILTLAESKNQKLSERNEESQARKIWRVSSIIPTHLDKDQVGISIWMRQVADQRGRKDVQFRSSTKSLEIWKARQKRTSFGTIHHFRNSLEISQQARRTCERASTHT